MEYIRNTTEFQIEEKTAVSLGKFDGLHKGHRRLTECLLEKGRAGLKTVIFTFDIPPKQKIGKSGQTKVLTTNEEKAGLFYAQGVDCLIECPFTDSFMRMEPEQFIADIVKKLHVKWFVVGEDFRFGHCGRGGIALLQELSKRYGYEVEVVEKVQENGSFISSTSVREAVLLGKMEEAGRLLGYHYFVSGPVAHGNKLGRTINVPTANLIPQKDKLLPPFGVYLTQTVFREDPAQAFGGITNVGCKPTVQGGKEAGVETHLFGFDRQIYGKEIKVEFLKFVRQEKKFDSLEELKKQMYKDIDFGIKYYANVTEMC